MANDEILEVDKDADSPDPDSETPSSRDVITQNYDLVVGSLIEQIKDGDVVLRPSFQRGYVWSNPTASKLIESIILNVPIPPCYLSQNENFELDVVDGQQRLESVYRFVDNQFQLSKLEVIKELNGNRFYQLPTRVQRQIKTHTVRCVMITNKSHPDVKFDIFERLNTNTSSLNAQELRNCLFRGEFNDQLRKMAEGSMWLNILGRKIPDKRMNGEEVILRFFAFKCLGLKSYRTPLKNWLNDAAKWGASISSSEIIKLAHDWNKMLEVSAIWFEPKECFRRPNSRAINKALFDLISYSASKISKENAVINREKFRSEFRDILKDTEFDDLISRAVDHKKRASRRFEIWDEKFQWLHLEDA